MRISFNMPDGTSFTSPEFNTPSEEVMDSFWEEYIGVETEDGELFWNSDLQGTDEHVHVDWFAAPTDPNKIVAYLSEALKVSVPSFSSWRSSPVRSWDEIADEEVGT